MIKAVVVDDEAGARKNIVLSLQRIPDIEIVAEASNVDEAIQKISFTKPDLVFLDVKMPQQSGFDLLDKLMLLGVKDFDVIFLTAYDEFAIQAIRYAAFDYLLKPIDMQELTEALIRFRNKETNTTEKKADALKQHVSNCKKIKIPTANGYMFIDPDTIVWFEAEQSYTRLNLFNGKSELISRNIGQLETELLPWGFKRVHKSFLVNKLHLNSFQKEERILLLKTENELVKIPVATRFDLNEL